MTMFAKFGAEIWRDFVSAGVPGSGAWPVNKPDMRAWMAAAERSLAVAAFTFDTVTADADPGAGKLRLNHATPASATAAYIDNQTASGSDATDWLDTFDDDGSASLRGTIRIADQTAPATSWRLYAVTGSVVDGTGYRKLTLVHLDGAGSFTLGMAVLLQFEPVPHSSFLQSGTGAVPRAELAKHRDILHVKDFGGVVSADGVTPDNTTALQALKAELEAQRNGMVLLTGGRYPGGKSFTSGTPIWSNNVAPLLLRADKPAVMGLFEGNASNPDVVTDDPILWVQKYTKFDNGSDANAQSVGGVFAEVVIKGSGATGTTETDAVWISILGNTVADGVNQGTEGAPDYDWDGSVIGVAGFARMNKPPSSPGIATALWGYATTPDVSATEFANAPAAFSVVGLEINIENRIGVDPGPLTGFGVKGTTAGILLGNFPSAIAKRDWSFGMVFYALPQDGNFSSTDPDNWNGFHDGMFIDGYKRAGIRFDRGRAGAVGILFPASYAHANWRPDAAIALGDNPIQMGNFTGTPADGHLWVTSQTLSYRNNGGTQFSISSVLNAVNRFEARGAATTGLPELRAVGSDTDISLIYRAKGNARHDFITGNGTQVTILNGGAANQVALNGGVATAPVVVSAVGSDTNIDILLTPKGAGNVRFGTHTAAGDAASNGYIEIKDAGGTVRRLMTRA